MARFYFNVREFGRLVEDPEGIDLPTVDAARDEAIKAAREIMSERLMRGEKPDHSRFEIADESGNLILVVAFTEAYTDD
jgi:hypothetical protein